jgi:hypothetical protein
VGRGPLHVDQSLSWTATHAFNKRDERNLRSVTDFVEHGLTREQPTYFNAVQASHEIAFPPHLHRMRRAEFMKVHVGIDEFLSYPTLRAVRIGASTHDVFETFIEGDRESSSRLR